VRAVLDAREKRQKTICFTTGVPGAGKTLVGLNTVHRPEIKDESLFLSGNGPLVKVIQEALVRDVVERSNLEKRRKTRRQAESKSKRLFITFIVLRMIFTAKVTESQSRR
jgi:hypothetical protein